MSEQLSLVLDEVSGQHDVGCLADPSGYRGLYAFHKYWGKKPHELLAFIVQRLTQPGDVVMDPFMGSGTAAREALLKERRFIGSDLNPIACELTRLLVAPPSAVVLKKAFEAISETLKKKILGTYRLSSGAEFASHYLWEGDTLKSVWKSSGLRKRTELEPTVHDLRVSEEYANYESSQIPQPCFFNNTRINTVAGLTLRDLFSGRALYNIDLLLSAIGQLDTPEHRALKLCLTAASGQMSKMVFAVTNRGKTRGERSSRIEVGSWVIGYWRPTLHFEVNVWNCFTRRVEKLLNALSTRDPLHGTVLTEHPRDVLERNAQAYVECIDSRDLLSQVPEQSVDLVITDPPHSDRIPYLELSAMWNALCGHQVAFDKEIVVSNAKVRSKSRARYSLELRDVLKRLGSVLKPSGHLVFLFNARNTADWEALQSIMDEPGSSGHLLQYVGCFPAQYSAGSVVQDNREGGLKYDYALVFSRLQDDGFLVKKSEALESIPGWSPEKPSRIATKD